MQDLHIGVRDQDIVVTMPGTNLRVVYRKPHRGSRLVVRLDYFQDQQKGPITRAEFLTRALKAANGKARELGWISARARAGMAVVFTSNARLLRSSARGLRHEGP